MQATGSGPLTFLPKPLVLPTAIGVSWVPAMLGRRRTRSRGLLPPGRRAPGAHRRPKRGGSPAVADSKPVSWS